MKTTPPADRPPPQHSDVPTVDRAAEEQHHRDLRRKAAARARSRRATGNAS